MDFWNFGGLFGIERAEFLTKTGLVVEKDSICPAPIDGNQSIKFYLHVSLTAEPSRRGGAFGAAELNLIAGTFLGTLLVTKEYRLRQRML